MATRKIVLVTGGNNGIGYEAVKTFLQSAKPYHILMGSRSLERANAAIDTLHKQCPESTNTIEALQLDLTSDSSIDKAFEQVTAKPGYVDALVNNAGAAFDPEYMAGRMSVRDCYNKAYDVNVAGTNVFTYTFMPLLLKSSEPRLLFVAGLSQINQAGQNFFPTPPQPAGWPKPKNYFETIGYRCSKTALNMLMLDWNHKLKADGVKVWGVGPGMLATNLGGISKEMAVKMGCQHASLGGTLIRSIVEGERDADVGKIANRDGISQW